MLILAAFGRVRPAELRLPVSRTARSLLACSDPSQVGTATALCGALLYAALTYYHSVNLAPGFEIFHAAFVAGFLLALAGSGLVTLVLLWLLGRLDLAPASSVDRALLGTARAPAPREHRSATVPGRFLDQLART